MEIPFRPRRGKGKVKTKKSVNEKAEETPESFDWDRNSAKRIKSIDPIKFGTTKVKSTLSSFLVLAANIRTPPGSGAGLIPLYLPRQEKMSEQELSLIHI